MNWITLLLCDFYTQTGRPCPKLADFANGYVEYSCKHATKRYGENCRYHCNGGYKLNGNEYRECSADGTWTGSVPTCDKIHQSKYIKRVENTLVINRIAPGPQKNTIKELSFHPRTQTLRAVNHLVPFNKQRQRIDKLHRSFYLVTLEDSIHRLKSHFAQHNVWATLQ